MLTTNINKLKQRRRYIPSIHLFTIAKLE